MAYSLYIKYHAFHINNLLALFLLQATEKGHVMEISDMPFSTAIQHEPTADGSR
jgi:hypothetical protein